MPSLAKFGPRVPQWFGTSATSIAMFSLRWADLGTRLTKVHRGWPRTERKLALDDVRSNGRLIQSWAHSGHKWPMFMKSGRAWSKSGRVWPEWVWCARRGSWWFHVGCVTDEVPLCDTTVERLVGAQGSDLGSVPLFQCRLWLRRHLRGPRTGGSCVGTSKVDSAAKPGAGKTERRPKP